MHNERCLDLRGFRSWVEEAKEWRLLLSGDHFSQTERKHVAFIKDKWEEARSIGVPGRQAQRTIGTFPSPQLTVMT